MGTLLYCPANHPGPNHDFHHYLFNQFLFPRWHLMTGILCHLYLRLAILSLIGLDPPSDAFTEKYQQIGLRENGLSAILESSPLLITLPGAYEGINLFWGKLRN